MMPAGAFRRAEASSTSGSMPSGLSAGRPIGGAIGSAEIERFEHVRRVVGQSAEVARQASMR
jgi:hypothetical protein